MCIRHTNNYQSSMLWYVHSSQINRIVYEAIKEKAWLHEANEVDNNTINYFTIPIALRNIWLEDLQSSVLLDNKLRS